MKLYYSPGACSLSPHIVALELGIPLEVEKVDLKTHKTASGEDFYAINPKGYVPFLTLDDGRFLSEGPAIILYLASQKPEANLTPAAGSFEYFKLVEWLAFINSEIHKSFAPLFGEAADNVKDDARTKIAKRFDYVNGEIAGKQYLMGDQFTVADAYLFVMLTWAHHLKIAIPANLHAFFARVSQRPKVHQAMKDEGLVK
ncbi:MAG TPA: glutathione transferase GstA [Rhizomicrobium sp.]|jgi:glutathione S-transferase